ncbi:hypothetical protein LINPERPRIM_LOCUS29162 [Linum perenne]
MKVHWGKKRIFDFGLAFPGAEGSSLGCLHRKHLPRGKLCRGLPCQFGP